MAVYPSALKTWTPVVDTVNEIVAADVNTGYAEITAVQTELGTDPAGTAADVKTRLARSLDGLGNLDFATSSTLTISGGSITPTQNWHTVDTEGSAASDDLVTINAANVTDGFMLVLRQFDDGRDVTVKHASDNISCPQGLDIVLSDMTQAVILIYDDTLEKWLAAVSPSNVAILTGVNTWTAENNFSKSVDFAYTTSSANVTLDATHHVMDVDASSGTITVTLPTAVGIAGRQYAVRKSDSSGNAVTIDGASAETINGASTKSLSSQYDTATIMSDGAGWIVL